jgi:hypothetical protein
VSIASPNRRHHIGGFVQFLPFLIIKAHARHGQAAVPGAKDGAIAGHFRNVESFDCRRVRLAMNILTRQPGCNQAAGERRVPMFALSSLVGLSTVYVAMICRHAAAISAAHEPACSHFTKRSAQLGICERRKIVPISRTILSRGPTA